MGFGFNLIGLPLLLLATILLLVTFFVTSSKIALILMGALWALVVALFIVSSISRSIETTDYLY